MKIYSDGTLRNLSEEQQGILREIATSMVGGEYKDKFFQSILLLLIKYFNEHPNELSLPKSLSWEQITSDENSIDWQIAEGINDLKGNPEASSLFLVLSSIAQYQDHVYAIRNKIFFGIEREDIDIISKLELNAISFKTLANIYWMLLDIHKQKIGRKVSTPYSLIKLMVELLNPTRGKSIYDPTCGTGELLLAAYSSAAGSKNEASKTVIYGQELNSYAYTLATLNLYFSGVSPETIVWGDTILNPHSFSDIKNQKFDYIISKLPNNEKIGSGKLLQLKEDNRFSYGLPKSNADFLFLQHAIACLNSNGRAVILSNPRILFVEGAEREIRKGIIDDDLIEAIISLPRNTLVNSKIPLCLIIINREKSHKNRGNIFFVYANEGYSSNEDGINYLEDFHIENIVNAVSRKIEIPRFSKLISIEEIVNHKYYLQPATYIDIVGLENFLGGKAEFVQLMDLGELVRGTQVGRIRKDGEIPVFKISDLSQNIEIDEISRVKEPKKEGKRIYTQVGDILISSIGNKLKTVIVEEKHSGILVDSKVFVLRLNAEFQYLRSYIVDFLQSDLGQAYTSQLSSGKFIPGWRVTDFRRLVIPIPNDSAISILSHVREVEKELTGRIVKAQIVRQRIFSIDDANEANQKLRELNSETQLLSESLIRLDDLEFQIRNFYPYPIASVYSSLNAESLPERYFQEQLRLAENILAFLGILGMSFITSKKSIFLEEDSSIDKSSLKDYFRGGVSPGDWQSIGFHSARVLLEHQGTKALEQFSSIWFRGKRRKGSVFNDKLLELVRVKNDYKHDRGPKTRAEYEAHISEVREWITVIFRELQFLIQYPLRLIEDIDSDFQTGNPRYVTRVYMGDHTGYFRQESIEHNELYQKNKLYIELPDENWIRLYPLISVEDCPRCANKEVFFLDRFDGPDGKIGLKSFERGHEISNKHDVVQEIKEDVILWLYSS